MAVSLPIVSEFNGKGIKKAVAEFKQLEGRRQKSPIRVKESRVTGSRRVRCRGRHGQKHYCSR
jgi:hypothetical protein